MESSSIKKPRRFGMPLKSTNHSNKQTINQHRYCILCFNSSFCRNGWQHFWSFPRIFFTWNYFLLILSFIFLSSFNWYCLRPSQKYAVFLNIETSSERSCSFSSVLVRPSACIQIFPELYLFHFLRNYPAFLLLDRVSECRLALLFKAY